MSNGRRSTDLQVSLILGRRAVSTLVHGQLLDAFGRRALAHMSVAGSSLFSKHLMIREDFRSTYDHKCATPTPRFHVHISMRTRHHQVWCSQEKTTGRDGLQAIMQSNRSRIYDDHLNKTTQGLSLLAWTHCSHHHVQGRRVHLGQWAEESGTIGCQSPSVCGHRWKRTTLVSVG